MVVAPMGLNSLVYFSLLTSCDSSTSSIMWAVCPTTLADLSAERKIALAFPSLTIYPRSDVQMPLNPASFSLSFSLVIEMTVCGLKVGEHFIRFCGSAI